LWAAATVTLGRRLTGRPDLRWNADFRWPRPANLQSYERLFGGELRFSQAQTRLLFPAWVLDLPIATANPELREQAESLALQEVQAQEREPEILRRTRLLIGQQLAAGRASLDAVAPLLGLSSRTLHRRLNDCGYSFRLLTDEVRQSRAERFLSNPAVPLAEIAFMLGYAEQSSFQHAFRRWTGLTPGEYRIRLRDVNGSVRQ
jgi:AraC-like DNA-binding protein